MLLLYILILFTFSIINIIHCQDKIFYCSPTSTLTTPNLIEINDLNANYQIVTRYESDNEYKPNMLCTWQIEAPVNHRIELFDFKIQLPFKADYASCNTYDYLEIDDLQICRDNFIKYVLSKDNKLFIKFSTNSINNAKGIQFSIRIWDTTTQCPKTWFKTKDNKCITIYDQNVKLSLDDSQAQCKQAQSNLASFDSQEQINEFLLNAFDKNLIKNDLFWIGLTDIENPGTLVWIEDKRAFNIKDINIKKDGENGDKNCIALEVSTNNDQKQPKYEFSRMSCTQKTIKLPFICKMNQTGITKLLSLPTEPSLKDAKDNKIAIFLKIGFPILAILIGACLGFIVVFTVKYEKKWSKTNICIARLSTYSIVTILFILFMILFIMGILTRSRFVLAVGIPILCLIFFTILLLICLKVKDHGSYDKSSVIKSDKTVTETELQDLKPKTKPLNVNSDLPSYDQATNP